MTTGHLPNGQENITDWPPVTGHRPPVKWALCKNFQVSQSPVTGHPATGLWTENINIESQYSPATGHQTLYLPTFSETNAMGMGH